MILNSEINTSSSLEIVEPEKGIEFSSSGSHQLDITQQKQLNYSKDQSSLSFHIEEQRKQSLIINTTLINEPPKRKRKQIFDKYKFQPLQIQQQSKQIIPNAQIQNDIMKAFDEIFSMGTPRSLSKDEMKEDSIQIVPLKNFSRKVYIEESQSKAEIRPMMQQQFNIIKTPQKNISMKRKQGSNPNIESPQNPKSSQFFKTPLELSKSKQKQNINPNKPQFLNLSQLEYRLSFIEGRQDMDNSKDSSDLGQILGAEIFRDKDSYRANNSKEDQQQKNIIPVVNIKGNKNDINMNASKFSDVYQRIDMSQSMTSSVVIKKPQYKFVESNYFLGGTQEGSLRNLSRTGSLGTINYQSSQTLINALGSQKIIQGAQQQQRVPIFMRKAVKLNSIVPNFQHKSVQLNLQKQNEKLQELVQNFSHALHFLQKMMEKVKNKTGLKKNILQQFANGITLTKFKACHWEKCIEWQGIEKLQPRQNLFVRQWSEIKVQKALQNYRKIIESHKGIRLNLRDERGITKYFQIRKKYWDIQKNIIIITDDVYSHILSLGFPKHYLQFKKIMEQNEIIFEHYEVRAKKAYIEKIKRLRSKGDELSLSEVGSFVLSKLNNQIKFNCSNF